MYHLPRSGTIRARSASSLHPVPVPVPVPDFRSVRERERERERERVGNVGHHARSTGLTAAKLLAFALPGRLDRGEKFQRLLSPRLAARYRRTRTEVSFMASQLF